MSEGGSNITDKLKERAVVIPVDELTQNKLSSFDPEIVIHLAAYLTSHDDESNRQKLIDSNITFGAKLCDALKTCSPKLFIDTGTFAQDFYNDGTFIPAYFYSATKLAFQQIFKYYQLLNPSIKYIQIVPYTVYGAKDSSKKLIDYIVDSFSTKEPIAMSPGEQVLDFIHIDDLVSLYVEVVKNVDDIKDKTIFYAGTGQGTTPKQLAILLSNISGKQTNINWGGLNYRPLDTMHMVAPIAKTTKLLNWKPKITLKEGLREYLKTIGDNLPIQ